MVAQILAYVALFVGVLILGVFLSAFIFGAATYFLWNEIITELIDAKQMTFTQALWIGAYLGLILSSARNSK